MNQTNPIEPDTARSMLDQLLEDSRMYLKGADYQNLLDFVVRLRNFAPFNALLLQIQKPGLRHAASARDWRDTFGRTISYLANYVKQDATVEQLDMYQIMRAAGQVESLLGLAAHTKVDRPKRKAETSPRTATSGDLFETSNP